MPPTDHPSRATLVRRERRLSSGELALWRTVMGVLPPTPVDPPAAAERLSGKPSSDKPSAGNPARAAAPPKSAQPLLTPAALLEPRLSTRLKRGLTPIEARLDLHGLTQEDAHAVLGRFLGQSAVAGRRLVLVITGKGGEREGRPGILQRSVPRWLAEGSNRMLVGSFASAHPRDGGSGAIYVVLRRRKAPR